MRRLPEPGFSNQRSGKSPIGWHSVFLLSFFFLVVISWASKAEDKVAGLDVPIPVAHGAKGIKLPYFDGNGKLQMDFSIGSAFRTDAEHLEMKGVVMQTYDENGKSEMFIEMPRSTLDLTTRMLKSDEPFTLRRNDFEMTGDTMQFNTVTKSGKVIGNVRMLIYNLSDLTGKCAK